MGRLGDGATSRRPFSSAGLARTTASATAAVKRGTSAWPNQSWPEMRSTHMLRMYINPKKIEEPRKLGADLPVLKPATPTPTPTPAPPAVAPVPPPVEAGPRRMARAPRQQLGSK